MRITTPKQLHELIRKVAGQFPKTRVPLRGQRLSAVLMPFYFKNGEAYLLFTRRSQKVRHHKGQVSFPGGAYDEEDGDLRTTALRETWEEIGVEPEAVEVIAEMDEMVTPSNFHITPFVGQIPYPYSFRINRDEIDEMIEIPFAHLLNPAHHRAEYMQHPRTQKQVLVHFFDYGEHIVWGVTGHLLYRMLQKMWKIEVEGR